MATQSVLSEELEKMYKKYKPFAGIDEPVIFHFDKSEEELKRFETHNKLYYLYIMEWKENYNKFLEERRLLYRNIPKSDLLQQLSTLVRDIETTKKYFEDTLKRDKYKDNKFISFLGNYLESYIREINTASSYDVQSLIELYIKIEFNHKLIKNDFNNISRIINARLKGSLPDFTYTTRSDTDSGAGSGAGTRSGVGSSAVATRSGDVATRSSAVATRSSAVATRSGDVATRSGDVATRSGDIATRSGVGSGDQPTRITRSEQYQRYKDLRLAGELEPSIKYINLPLSELFKKNLSGLYERYINEQIEKYSKEINRLSELITNKSDLKTFLQEQLQNISKNIDLINEIMKSNDLFNTDENLKYLLNKLESMFVQLLDIELNEYIESDFEKYKGIIIEISSKLSIINEDILNRQHFLKTI
jgi:hypothetical protein